MESYTKTLEVIPVDYTWMDEARTRELNEQAAEAIEEFLTAYDGDEFSRYDKDGKFIGYHPVYTGTGAINSVYSVLISEWMGNGYRFGGYDQAFAAERRRILDKWAKAINEAVYGPVEDDMAARDRREEAYLEYLKAEKKERERETIRDKIKECERKIRQLEKSIEGLRRELDNTEFATVAARILAEIGATEAELAVVEARKEAYVAELNGLDTVQEETQMSKTYPLRSSLQRRINELEAEIDELKREQASADYEEDYLALEEKIGKKEKELADAESELKSVVSQALAADDAKEAAEKAAEQASLDTMRRLNETLAAANDKAREARLAEAKANEEQRSRAAAQKAAADAMLMRTNAMDAAFAKFQRAIELMVVGDTASDAASADSTEAIKALAAATASIVNGQEAD